MLPKKNWGLMALVLTISLPIIFYSTFNTGSTNEADFSMFNTEELEWLNTHKKIHYAPDPDFYPFEYYEDGLYKGLSIDYISWISDQYDLNIETVSYDTWDQILRAARDKKVDLVTSTARSSEREKFLIFTAPYTYMDYVAFVRSDQNTDFFEHDLVNMKTAVIRNYAAQDILGEKYPDISLILVNNVEDGFIKLKNSEVDVFIASTGQAFRVVNDKNISGIKVNENIRLLDSLPLSMGTHRDNPILISILNKILSRMPQRVKNDIFDQWMTIEFADTFTSTLYSRLIIISLAVTLLIVFVYMWNQILNKRVRAGSKKIETELHQRRVLESQLKNIIDNIPSPIYVKNSQGDFVHVNQNFCDLIGVPSVEEIGNTSVLKAESKERFQAMEEYVLRKGLSIRDKANSVTFKDGREMILDSIKIPFQVLGENTQGVLSIDIDITERVRLKKDLSKANKELEEKVKERSLAIEAVNDELEISMEQIRQNELKLQKANAELTALLKSLRETQMELIEKETISAQGQNLNKVSMEISKPMQSALEKNENIRIRISALMSDIARHNMAPNDLKTTIKETLSALDDIYNWLKASSRVIETFKIISLVDHGYQPSQINLKLMLENTYSQILDSPVSDYVTCEDNIILMASPNAFSQILNHLITYMTTHSMDFENTRLTPVHVIAHKSESDLCIRIELEIDSKTPHVIDTHIDLGLQIIESVIKHYFSGSIEETYDQGKHILKMSIPNMFLAISSSQDEGGDLNA